MTAPTRNSATPERLVPVSPALRPMLGACAAVFVAALMMGAPLLRGAFLGGDDIQLVRDHVLVNRPSVAHALQILDPATHRDLYQPVALLSFQLNFTMVRALGLEPVAPGEVPGVWVFHLTNVLLHGVCAVLVCALAWRLTGRASIAAATGVLFALHPLNVEAVAWINGRMMLLSTVFLLAAILLCERFRDRGGLWRGAVVVLLVALCHMSKVRMALPLLLLAPIVVQRVRLPRRWWCVWGVAAALTAWFVGINLATSESMIAGGDAHLTGSPIVRTVLALGWYVSRIFVPVGLSPYHPAAGHVDWSHPQLPFAAIIVALAVVALLVSVKRTRLGWAGAVWMVVALAATLPLIATRNLAVADRYMYLPLVGALWPVAGGLVLLVLRIPKAGRAVVAAGIVCGLLATSWRTATYYRDDVSRSRRIVGLYPQYPRMHVMHAWALYRAGEFRAAMAAADSVRQSDDPAAASDAWQVIGATQARLGDQGAALSALRRAVTLDPASGVAHKRLGLALVRAGETDAALSEFERAAELAPTNNPALHELARLQRQLGRADAARRVYGQILANNPYDAEAAVNLAELEIAARDYDAALTRLAGVLASQPEAVRVRAVYAWSNYLAGRVTEAEAQARKVLVHTSDDVLARSVNVGIALAQAASKSAIRQTEELLKADALDDAAAFDAFAAVMQSRAHRHPDDPWPYYLMCMACVATGQTEAAEFAAEEFKRRINDPAQHQRVDALLESAARRWLHVGRERHGVPRRGIRQ